MSKAPTKEQLGRLPVWAQDLIKNVTRERDTAVAALHKFTDEQKETPVHYQVHECIGGGSGPTRLNRYIQANTIHFSLPRAAMELEVSLNVDEQRIEIRAPRGYPYIQPVSGNNFYVVPSEDIYLTPNAVTLCQAAVEAPKLSHDAFVKKFGFSHEALHEMMRKVVPKSHWNRTVGG